MSTADLHTLTGAYSVHALPEGEREEFERHLAECTSCTQEVRELTSTAQRLGLAATVAPPAEMKQRVLREIATVRQEPPQVPGRRRPGGGTGRVRALPRFALAAALAAAAALGGVAAWQYQAAEDARQQAEAQARQAEQRSETLARVLAAPDAKVNSAEVADGATGAVVVSRSEDRAAFFASGLPQAPKGKVYQLWFSEDGAMRPAGLLDSAADGETVLMEGAVGGASGMGITVEPAGGSSQPTSDPVALMELPA